MIYLNMQACHIILPTQLQFHPASVRWVHSILRKNLDQGITIDLLTSSELHAMKRRDVTHSSSPPRTEINEWELKSSLVLLNNASTQFMPIVTAASSFP
jgi:hypothetical protein